MTATMDHRGGQGNVDGPSWWLLPQAGIRSADIEPGLMEHVLIHEEPGAMAPGQAGPRAMATGGTM